MVTESTTTFGELLRQYRVAPGLTQEQLAERAGLSAYGIQKLERGTTQPFRDTAARLTAALELSPDEAERFRAAVEPVRRRGTMQRDAPGPDRNHTLPIALTSFIGREQELASTPPRLRATRLLTLTGVGGSGKDPTCDRACPRHGRHVSLRRVAGEAGPVANRSASLAK